MTAPPPTGFDIRPRRPAVITAMLFAGVVVVAAGGAYVFRRTAFEVIGLYSDGSNPTTAADRTSPLIVFVVVSASVALASVLGHLAYRRWDGRVGIEAVAASARGEGRSISVTATAVRVAGTWVATTGMTSIGRETAIVEAGGAIGAVTARRTRGRGDAMATAGMAAAFAAAYHAPVAAVLYVEEHLRVRRSKRAIMFSVLAAGGGQAAAIVLFGGKAVFPPLEGDPWGWRSVPVALLGLLPAVLVARLFLQLRVRLTCANTTRWFGGHHWWSVAALSCLAGASVAVFPFAAGNGMEGLRQVSVAATFTLAMALLIGKVVGTAAALGAGAPGGVVTPSIAMASGAALVTMLTAERMGVTLAHPWDAIVLVMAVGVAVGIRAPLMAVFLIPEMVGDYRLVPVTATMVLISMLVDRALDVLVRRVGVRVPSGVYDEDA